MGSVLKAPIAGESFVDEARTKIAICNCAILGY